MSVVEPILALFLAAVLAAASVHKLADRVRLTQATADLLRLAPPIAMPLTMAAAAAEFAAALALLFPASRPAGALLAALLWAGYGAALFAARRRGDGGIDCGCDFGAPRHGIGSFAIGRAVALGAVALSLCFSPTGGGAIDISSVFAALAFVALLFATGEIANLPAASRSSTR
ncbi:MauE/DoxX family redox-associated membrane protein [Sphingopyxis sp.]|uniref:MauE/DoxX family redox-associated membrane protein n=1 Tax=Sphingopyxis sp. TaxID=1908224 RepID=UPI002B47A18B|nr:MauE/DoxX family redox-associated membrane protein [Sphingopyxis sp.]HJS13027.1 MauE/DoxX family redox-associated membrane protein [Sphingopyxis sp.]